MIPVFNRIACLTSVLLLVFPVVEALSQNQLPVVRNIKSKIDRTNRIIEISYDVADAEDDSIKISMNVNNKRVSVKTMNLSGDIGHVRVGKQKKITWKYDSAFALADNEDVRIKLVADDLYKIPIADLLRQVDTVRLRNTVKKIYGERGYSGKQALKHIAEVKSFIENSLSQNLPLVLKQNVEYNGFHGQNIIGKKEGVDDENKVYILCAHFDAAEGSPGGDDNATGVAGLLEAVAILSKYTFSHSLNFIGFDLEEVGLMGSDQYVFNRGIKKDEHIEGVVNFDMIGYYSEKPGSQQVPDGFDQLFPDAYETVSSGNFRGNFVVNTSNAESAALSDAFKNAAMKYVPALKIVSLRFESVSLTPTLAASDHYNFWRKKIKALHIGDGGESRNVYLNTPNDSLNGLNYTFMGNIVKATIASLAELAILKHCYVAEFSVGKNQ